MEKLENFNSIKDNQFRILQLTSNDNVEKLSSEKAAGSIKDVMSLNHKILLSHLSEDDDSFSIGFDETNENENNSVQCIQDIESIKELGFVANVNPDDFVSIFQQNERSRCKPKRKRKKESFEENFCDSVFADTVQSIKPSSTSLHSRNITPGTTVRKKKMHGTVLKRSRKNYSQFETATLIKEVLQKGMEGKWMEILKAYPKVFADRESLDLHYKWKNLKKKKKIKAIYNIKYGNSRKRKVAIC